MKEETVGLFSIDRRYVIGPENREHYVISQMFTGPHKEDYIDGPGQYYVSREVYTDGQWVHQPGSAVSHKTLQSAQDDMRSRFQLRTGKW